MSISTELDCITIPPRDDSPVGSVIWLHGLGANAHDFSGIVTELDLPQDLPIRFIFPHAPERTVTANGHASMRAWYDIYSFENLDREDRQGMLEAQKLINSLINKEIAAGIPSEKIVLAGFSQGGAMALYTGLRYPKQLNGILALSTYLPCATDLAQDISEANRNMNIFVGHGSFDPVLPIMLGKVVYQQLEALGCQVEWHDYPTEHEVTREEIVDFSSWLRCRFS